MGETIKQENFDDILFGDNKEEKDKKPESEDKLLECHYCEDVGPCSYCTRGKIEQSNQPKSDLFKKLREH